MQFFDDLVKQFCKDQKSTILFRRGAVLLLAFAVVAVDFTSQILSMAFDLFFAFLWVSLVWDVLGDDAPEEVKKP